jgi:PPOX class probable F420-dependent enzyme
MTLTSQAREYLNGKLFAVLATINPSGSPQQTVMWYELRDDTIVMNTAMSRVKERNLARDKRISVCISDGDRYITIAGQARMESNRATAMADIRRLAERYSDEEDAVRREEDTVKQMEMFAKQERISIYLPVERVLMWGFD